MEGLEPPSTRFQAEVSAAGLHPDYETTKWWERESNSRHPALQASALPTELSHRLQGTSLLRAGALVAMSTCVLATALVGAWSWRSDSNRLGPAYEAGALSSRASPAKFAT